MKSSLLLILLASCMLLSQRTLAQFWPPQDNTRGTYALLSLEFPTAEYSAVNKELRELGYPEKKISEVTIGGGGHVAIYRYVFDMIGNFWNYRPPFDTVDLRNKYSTISIDLGYDLLKSPFYSLYPYAGIKYFHFTYLYNQKTNTPQTFGSYFSTPLDHKKMENSRNYLDLGLSFSTQNYLYFGFRAGYVIPLDHSEWLINDNTVKLENAPGISYRGYITVTMGLGMLEHDWPKRKTQPMKPRSVFDL